MLFPYSGCLSLDYITVVTLVYSIGAFLFGFCILPKINYNYNPLKAVVPGISNIMVFSPYFDLGLNDRLFVLHVFTWGDCAVNMQ